MNSDLLFGYDREEHKKKIRRNYLRRKKYHQKKGRKGMIGLDLPKINTF